jgi:hypothetical protein
MSYNESFSEKLNKLTEVAENLLLFLEALHRVAAKITDIVNTCSPRTQQTTSSSTADNTDNPDTRFFY